MAWRELITPENKTSYPSISGAVCVCVGWECVCVGGSHYGCTGTTLNVSVGGGQERADEE